MPENQPAASSPWNRTPVWIVSFLLVAQIAAFYTMSTSEYVPSPPPLNRFESTVGPWRMIAENPIETEVQELLKADDTMNRQYAGPGGQLNLFVAFFKTQRAGVSPHSPKVCLPGNGWEPESSSTISIAVPGEPQPILVNRYGVSRGENRTVVLYWYQTRHRVVANEYMAKLYLILDSMRYRRSDTALVRVLAPVMNDQPPEVADRSAIQFIQTMYSPLKQQMWTD